MGLYILHHDPACEGKLHVQGLQDAKMLHCVKTSVLCFELVHSKLVTFNAHHKHFLKPTYIIHEVSF
jgi:hypothetical protein